jgi:hypothetical protein
VAPAAPLECVGGGARCCKHPPTPHHTFAVALRMRSIRVSSFLSWWWLPLPLLMISTPARARLMWGALGERSRRR